jgi:hypothetical protein
MHQAFVTGLHWAVFVTAKLEADEGSIVQYVVARVPDLAKREYADVLIPRATALVGWLHDEEVLARGYLVDSDFPDWLGSDKRKTVASHYKLWAAQRKKVRVVTEDGVEFNPMPPVASYKHSSQCKYNCGKWGLDKNTEMSEEIKLSAPMMFEPKYTHRILRGILVSLWRSKQAIKIVKPYIMRYRAEHEGCNPSANQIRAVARELPLTDFVRVFSFESIAHFQTLERRVQMARPLPLAAAALPAPNEAGDIEIDNIIADLHRRKKWPVQKHKMTRFSVAPLSKFRLYLSARYAHQAERIPGDPEKNTFRKQICALCSKSAKCRRIVRKRCKDCLVPLCTVVYPGKEMSHFDMWHTVTDLKSAWEECTACLAETKEARKRKRRTGTRDAEEDTNMPPGEEEEGSGSDNKQDEPSDSDDEGDDLPPIDDSDLGSLFLSQNDV